MRFPIIPMGSRLVPAAPPLDNEGFSGRETENVTLDLSKMQSSNFKVKGGAQDVLLSWVKFELN